MGLAIAIAASVAATARANESTSREVVVELSPSIDPTTLRLHPYAPEAPWREATPELRLVEEGAREIRIAVPPGRWVLTGRRVDGTTDWARFRAGSPRTEMWSQPYGTASVVVTALDGSALPDAQVEVRPVAGAGSTIRPCWRLLPRVATAATDGDTPASVAVPLEPAVIEVRAPGRATRWWGVPMRHLAGDYELTLRLAPGVDAVGVAVDAEGAPIAEAVVVALPSDVAPEFVEPGELSFPEYLPRYHSDYRGEVYVPKVAIADATGAFRLSALQPYERYRVTVTSSDGRWTTRELATAGTETAWGSIPLGGPRLLVRVVDPVGEPVHGATLGVPGLRRRFISDEAGRVGLPVPYEWPDEVHATHERWASGSAEITDDHRTGRTPVTIQLRRKPKRSAANGAQKITEPRTKRPSVLLHLEVGDTAPRVVHVWATDSDGEAAHRRVNERDWLDGTARITLKELSDEFAIRVTGPTHVLAPQQLELPSDGSPVEVVLPRAEARSVRAVGHDGVPLPHVLLAWTCPIHGHRVSTYTDGGGNVRRRLSPGTVDDRPISVSERGVTRHQLLPEPHDDGLDLLLSSAVQVVHARVLHEGRPLRRRKFRVQPGRVVALTDSNGIARLVLLTSDTRRGVSVSTRIGDRRVTAELAVDPDDTSLHVVELR